MSLVVALTLVAGAVVLAVAVQGYMAARRAGPRRAAAQPLMPATAERHEPSFEAGDTLPEPPPLRAAPAGWTSETDRIIADVFAKEAGARPAKRQPRIR